MHSAHNRPAVTVDFSQLNPQRTQESWTRPPAVSM